ncbi:MAG: hypothetical protein FRX48_05617 [Lasallia pustulata]|uniref:Uncharacterized protein n=1 Tax=Lasallia pustulata TaxID=136370 RepID=A0A5M8PMS1_9LECA|nr:MAG: hypothetical protein FRX48_05617 [Lasallia pustulata]
MRPTMPLLALVACIASTANADPAQLEARQNCGSNYSKCSPSGATSTNIPAVGGDLSGLYVDVLDSINGVKFSKRGALDLASPLGIRSSSATVCCAAGTTCLTLANINAPFCYDHFTTNFYLSDGSYGTLTTGAYTASDSTTINLLTGNYTLPNGQPGNIYSAASAPNTATLSLPTLYTSAGVGSAIPASELGGIATYTTTIPGTTVEPTTLPAQTVTVVTTQAGGSTAVVGMTTVGPTTLPGTTLPAVTETYTKAVAATGAAKKGEAGGWGRGRVLLGGRGGGSLGGGVGVVIGDWGGELVRWGFLGREGVYRSRGTGTG